MKNDVILEKHRKSIENGELHRGVTEVLREIYIKKNIGYGNSYEQTHERLGIKASVGQINHKMNRVIEQVNKDVDYDLVDDLQDLANYVVMLIMILQKEEV